MAGSVAITRLSQTHISEPGLAYASQPSANEKQNQDVSKLAVHLTASHVTLTTWVARAAC